MDGQDPLFSLSGKIALVTGGTSGIGLMIARGLVRRGVRTYITGRDAAQADEVAVELSRSEDGSCVGLAADFALADAPTALAAAIREREARLDILVNNAGTNVPGSLAGLTLEDWDRAMAVNVRGPLFLARELLAPLCAAATSEDPARIINVGSIGGLHVPDWEAHPYGASKAAVQYLTRSLAKALGQHHITVNAIAPGPFPSKMHDTTSDATQRSIARYIPLRRAGEAADVEGAVVFLASRAGAYVNGHILPLDGGYIGAL